jgi:hypothetical protein
MRKNLTLREIGLEMGVTAERVRQILNKKELKLCKKHNLHFAVRCKYCFQEANYKSLLKNHLKKNGLEAEIRRLAKPGRKAEVIVQKKLLIKKLHDEIGLSFNAIAKLLKRDHSTISFLYLSK